MIKKEIKKEIEKILKEKIEVPFIREGNFVKFRMPGEMERPQVFINGIPSRYKKLGGMCYVEVEEGLYPQKVEVCENVDIWNIANDMISENDSPYFSRIKIAEKPVVLLTDPYQKEAIEEAVENNYTLIFGPPGSGKTTVIAEIVKNVIGDAYDKIAILSLSNLAVDNVLERLGEFKEETVRVGTPFLDTVKEMTPAVKIKERRKHLRKEYLKALAYEIAKSKTEYYLDQLGEKEITYREIEKEIGNLTKTKMDRAIEKTEENINQIKKEMEKLEGKIDRLSVFSFLKKRKIREKLQALEKQLEKERELLSSLFLKKEKELKPLSESKESMLKALLEKKIAIAEEIAKLKAKAKKFSEKANKYRTSRKPEDITEEIEVLKTEERRVIAKAKIIGTTIHTFLFRYRKFSFDTIIVDEVSQVPYPFIVVLRKMCRRLVLLGDPHQLPPVTKTGIPNIFHFEKPHVVLRNVRRYPDKIGAIVNKLYGENLNCIRKGGEIKWIDIKGKVKRENGKIYNEKHIQEIEKIAKKDGNIAVVTPYKYQAYLLRKKGIEAGTIHSFQGQERDEIVIDLTDPDSKFINRNMLIVALSRAKEKVVIIGDLDKALNSKNKTVKQLAEFFIEEKKKEKERRSKSLN
ncbi:AAA domain-containing protein [Persephonella sp. KM09-Lau-8]|uniref:DEAD/DEAH box helicase n=1 Tax=Persephonella sp. KM09-Lau-8 TaxID=1158345 RepID=UPI0004964A3D|nr:AAA domain-containing protein [Persephonella sp. KM09-Lau-8]